MTTLSEALRSVAPGEVEHVLLSSVARIVSGGTPKTGEASFWDGDVPWVTPKDLSGLASVEIHSTSRLITEAGLRNSSAEILPENSVLFSSRAPIGLLAINKTPMATNQGFKSFVPDPEKLDSRYLFRWLEANRAKLQNMGVGATFKEVSKAIVSRLVIPLPSLDEQRRIAGVLDKADELRTKRRQALAQLDVLTQSIFYSMFGDPARNAHEFPKRELVDLCAARDDIRCGPFGTQLNKNEFRSAGVPLWGIKNVNKSFELPTYEFLDPATAERLDSYSILPGDIVMTRKGTVGNCSVYPENFPRGIMHSDLLRLRIDPDIANVRFISDQLHSSRDVSHQVSLISGGAVMAGINVSKLKTIKVLVPPLADQNEYARRVTAVDRLKDHYQAQLAELDVLFASLQHRAFKGEL